MSRTISSELEQLLQKYDDQLTVHTVAIQDDAGLEGVAASFGEPIDVFIANAGVYGPRDQGLNMRDPQVWNEVFDVNVRSVLTQAYWFQAHLQRSKRPLFVAISSKMGSIQDNTSGGAYVYRASKAALNQAMRSLSHDWSPLGIDVFVLHPGWVRTDMGGPNAWIDATTSIQGMAAQIDKQRTDGGFRFVDYEGKPIPW
jgi:NAD(P)-dependent dehydrogenase (short-subunit alcohol dehydrogenase family)